MSHDHAHAPAGKSGDLGRAFLVGILLNVAFVAVESVFGVLAHSTALLADAAHELEERFGIAHSTVQIEPSSAPESCQRASAGSV